MSTSTAGNSAYPRFALQCIEGLTTEHTAPNCTTNKEESLSECLYMVPFLKVRRTDYTSQHLDRCDGGVSMSNSSADSLDWLTAPGFAFASRIACRSEPSPLSLRFVTVKVIDGDGATYACFLFGGTPNVIAKMNSGKSMAPHNLLLICI